jgi:ketosteroid isomerase-like protein
MKLTRWMKTTFASALSIGVLSSSAASQVKFQEPTKRGGMRIVNGILTLVIVCWLLAPVLISRAAGTPKPAAGPTAENALAAEQEVARALLANDADAVGRLLADDWVVISTYGGMGDRAGFLAVIKSGDFTRKTMDLSDLKVRLYGNMALVTSQLKTSGTLGGKSFDVAERQTDVLIWQDGGWKSVLTHETQIRQK